MSEAITVAIISGLFMLGGTWLNHYLDKRNRQNSEGSNPAKLVQTIGIRKHLFMGRGLFYANRNLSRRYLYVAAFFAALTLIFENLFSSDVAWVIGVVGLTIYLMGFLDTAFHVWRANRLV